MLFKINLQSSVWFHHRINFRKDRKIGVVYVQCTLSGVGGGGVTTANIVLAMIVLMVNSSKFYTNI